MSHRLGATGDVSLAAYIQSAISAGDPVDDRGHPPTIFCGYQVHRRLCLGAVMAFSYSSYIVMDAILSATLGKVADHGFTAHANIESSLRRIGG